MMKKNPTDLRLLLLQIRDEPAVRQEEHTSFARYSGLAPEQIEVLNVFDTPDFPPGVIDGFDALLVGGGSEASVLEPEKYPFLRPAMALLLHCIDQEVPVFASCFGFQLAVIALGGRLIRDRAGFEMGSIPIRLSEQAQSDPLFQDTTDGFLAVAVHKERALEPPPGTRMLAFTNACCHAFRVEGKPFWAFQFHPEVDRQVLIDRLTVFRDQYTEGVEHLEGVLSTAQETPESNLLPRKFVERVLLGEHTWPNPRN
jgi:GMP synthase (glutamine-hydrolysing)